MQHLIQQTKSFGFFRFVVLGVIFFALIFGMTTQNVFAAGWTNQTGAGTKYWTSIASSDDGTNLFAAANPGSGIWTSTDSGVNWVDRSTVGLIGGFSVASSADGTKLFVGSGNLYRSTDGGANWTETSMPLGSRAGSVAVSDDGMNLIIGHSGNSGSLYTSTDGGASVTEQTGAGSGNWYGVTSSSDGTKLAAANYGGYIYTSTDSGATWTERTSLGTGNWYALASSADGMKLAAGVYVGGGYIYTSTDGGANWTEQTDSGVRPWTGIASSSDGTILTAIAGGGDYIYLSTDSGATWTAQTSAGTGGGGWYAVTSSADGTKLAAGGAVGNIYTGLISLVPTVTTGSTSSLSTTSVTLAGNITDIGGSDVTARGIEYGTTTGYGTTSTQTGTFSTGSFTRNITGLTCNTFYHYRAFATNTGGTATGSDGTFTTSACVSVSKPTLTTGSATSVTQTSAVLNATITATGGENATTRGVYYLLAADLSPSPHNISSTTAENGSYGVGDFSGTATGLTCGTDYAFAPYAENSAGSQTGDIGYFSTSACVSKPTVVTGSASSITQTSVTLGATITATGGENATTRGVYYLLAADLSPSPHNISSTTPETGSYGTGAFSGTVTGLTCATDYAFAAYAENSAGSQTGDVEYFSTGACGGAESLVITSGQLTGGSAYTNTNNFDVGGILGSGACPANLIIHDFMRKGDKNGFYSSYYKNMVKEVGLLQSHINRILATKYHQAAGPVDGIFGLLTMRGVERLQIALNEIVKPVPLLKIDGIVGNYTRAAINNSCGGM